MDDRADHFFCGTYRDLKKQSEYGIEVSGTGCSGRHFDLWHEPVLFDTKCCFYYCAESAYGFDMRISRNSGVFIAFLYSDTEHGIEISQKLIFVKKGLDRQEKTSYNRNYFKSPFGLERHIGRFLKIFLTFYF